MDQTISVPPTYKMKHDFDRDGYLSIKPLFNAIKVAEINRELDRFIKEVVPNMSSKEVYLEDKSDPASIKQLMNMNHHDGYICALAENSVLREIATKVLGEDVIPTNVEYFNISRNNILTKYFSCYLAQHTVFCQGVNIAIVMVHVH